jgi:hypothetical protein
VDGDVPCIQLAINIVAHGGCDISGSGIAPDPCPAGAGDLEFHRMIPGSNVGLNQVFNLDLIGVPPVTHPYGAYSYEKLGVPVSLTYQRSLVNFYASRVLDDQGNFLHFQCVKQTVTQEFFFNTANMYATAEYDEIAPPRYRSVSVTISGVYRFTTRDEYFETGEDDTQVSNGTIFHEVFNPGVLNPSTLFGSSIANDVTKPASCDFGHDNMFSDGTCTVSATAENDCFDFPPVYKAIPCGSPPAHILSEIYVDVARVQGGGGFNRFPYHQAWPYMLTDELMIDTLETPGVSTLVVQGCFPRVVLCGGGSPLPFDDGTKPPAANSAYFGGFQFYPDGGAHVPGPAGDFDWSLDTCPGPAPMMASPDDNPLKKKGMVSEAQLDAMGASPEDEARRMRQGGCCSPPEPID